MKTVYISLFILLIGCGSSLTIFAQDFSPEKLKAFEQTIDTMSLENLRTSIHHQRRAADYLIKFAPSFPNNDEVKNYLPKDEETNDPFTLDTLLPIKQFNDALTTPLTFAQNFQDDHTELIFQAEGDKEIHFKGEGYLVKFIPASISYANGRVQTDSIPFHSIDYHFGVDWGVPRTIDSIVFKVTLEYVDQMDSIEVSVNQKETNDQGGQLKIVKADHNFVYYTVSDTIKRFKSEVLNATGTPLQVDNYASGPMDPSKMDEWVKELGKTFAQLDEKLKDPSLTVESARKYIKKALASVDCSEFNPSKIWHYNKWCRGNVHALRLFTIKHQTTLQGHITAVNVGSNRIVCLYSKDRTSMTLMNENGDQLLTTPALTQINSNYYEGARYYYYFNEATLAMDTLRSYYLYALSDNLVCRQEDQGSPYVLYNRYNKVVGNLPTDIFDNDTYDSFGKRLHL